MDVNVVENTLTLQLQLTYLFLVMSRWQMTAIAQRQGWLINERCLMYSTKFSKSEKAHEKMLWNYCQVPQLPKITCRPASFNAYLS